jgi:hypothetical protein
VRRNPLDKQCKHSLYSKPHYDIFCGHIPKCEQPLMRKVQSYVPFGLSAMIFKQLSENKTEKKRIWICVNVCPGEGKTRHLSLQARPDCSRTTVFEQTTYYCFEMSLQPSLPVTRQGQWDTACAGAWLTHCTWMLLSCIAPRTLETIEALTSNIRLFMLNLRQNSLTRDLPSAASHSLLNLGNVRRRQ